MIVLTAYNNFPSMQYANSTIPHADRKNGKGILNNLFTSTTRRRTQIVLTTIHLSVREPITLLIIPHANRIHMWSALSTWECMKALWPATKSVLERRV